MALYRTLGLTVPVSELLNVAAWRERYAWGIPLAGTDAFTPTQQLQEACAALGECNGDGQVQALVAQIPDSVVRWHLRAAMSELEIKLGAPLGVVVVKTPPLESGVTLGQHFDKLGQRMPFYHHDALEYWRLSLPYSVLSVERVRGVYFGTTIVEVAGSSVIVEWPGPGSVHINPLDMSAALASSVAYSNAQAYELFGDLWRAREQVPDFWAVDYTLGPRDKFTGEPGQVEVALAHWVGLRAAGMLINIAGTAYGQGIASTSLSMDGITRAITTSQSAMYGINSAYELVIKAYAESIDWKALRTIRRGLPVFKLSGGSA